MNVATLWFETTSHSHFFTLSAEAGTSIDISSLIFTWQPRRHFAAICLRLKKPTSVGRISPPPSVTRHLHCPQAPLPPHADGRKIFCSASVERRFPPGVTSTILLPSLILIFTVPSGVSFVLMKRRSATSRSVRITIAITDAKIVVVIVYVLLY